ncbi:arginyl-tRNA synthetase [Cutibacterium acnes JCM 18909]|nr:arginyl-tRNA synthetase [Cutibacterium acnes JCM 18909]
MADGLAVEDNGALCVFVEGQDAPMIVRKRDGGFGYDATDLAAIRRRVGKLKADRIIYVTDVRQSHHFEVLFQVARMAGFLPDDVEAEHVGYGMVFGLMAVLSRLVRVAQCRCRICSTRPRRTRLRISPWLPLNTPTCPTACRRTMFF